MKAILHLVVDHDANRKRLKLEEELSDIQYIMGTLALRELEIERKIRELDQ